MVAEVERPQQAGWLERAVEGERLTLRAGGVWVVATIADLDRLVSDVESIAAASVQIDLSDVSRLDTSGAMLFYRAATEFESRGAKVE